MSSRLRLSSLCCWQVSGLETDSPGQLQLLSESKRGLGTVHGATQSPALQAMLHMLSAYGTNTACAVLTTISCSKLDRPQALLHSRQTREALQQLLGVDMSAYLLRPEPPLKREGCGDNANGEDAQGLSSCCYNRGGATTSSPSHTCLHYFRMQSGDHPINAADKQRAFAAALARLVAVH